MNDLELIDKVKNEGCSESFSEIVERHSPLYWSICNKYKEPMTASGVHVSDMDDDKLFFIYESIKSYDPEKNSKYSTWLANWTKYKCLSKITSSNRVVTKTSEFLDFCSEKESDCDDQDEANKADAYDFIKEQLADEKDDIKEIFNLRYFSNEKKNRRWSDIGKKLGISTQTAINRHDRVVNKIKMRMRRKSFDF